MAIPTQTFAIITSRLINCEMLKKIKISQQNLRKTVLNPGIHTICTVWKPGTILNETVLSRDSLYKLLVAVFWPHLGWKRTLTSSHGLMATWGCQIFYFLPLWHRKTTTRTKNCFCHWENDKCNGVKYSCSSCHTLRARGSNCCLLGKTLHSIENC